MGENEMLLMSKKASACIDIFFKSANCNNSENSFTICNKVCYFNFG